MHERLKSLEVGFFIGISFLFTIFLGTTIYAALSGKQVTSGEILTAEMWNNLSSNIEIPSGLVASFNLKECPTGWLPANGSGSIAGEDIPDLRGKFVRGLNSFENGENKLTGTGSDEDGVDRLLGSLQEDAIRNIFGQFGNPNAHNLWGDSKLFTRVDRAANPYTGNSANSRTASVINFDTSKIVPTGSDNRPQNIALIYCIKE